MTDDDLLEILTKSRENNLKRDITGVLLYSDGAFIQMLEGKANDINFIYDKILQDTRHKNIIKLVHGTAMARSFPNWSMGFRSINSEELKTLRGYFDLKDGTFTGTHPGLSMIRTFTEINRG